MIGTHFRPIFGHNFWTGSPISKFFFLRPSAQKIRKRDFFAFFKIFYPFLVYGQKRVPKFGALCTFTTSSDHNFWTVRPIFKIFFWNLYFLMLFDRSCVKSSYFWLDFSENVKNWFSDRNQTPSCFLKEHFFCWTSDPNFGHFMFRYNIS